MQPEAIFFEASDWVPNNPNFPALIYKTVLPDGGSEAFEQVFEKNGWTGIWRNGVFDYQHYHSGAHEVLGVGRGNATLLIGGPGGKQISVSAGDCLVLPVGTGHKNQGCSDDFEVVGAYPSGQHADIITSSADTNAIAKIRDLPRPDTDPIMGLDGGLVEIWR